MLRFDGAFMKYITITLLLLAACAPRADVANEAHRFREICTSKAYNGYIKTAEALVECESKQVLRTAQISGFSEQDRLLDYYMERFSLAKKIDKKTISPKSANKQETAIEEKYASLFNSDDSGATLSSIKINQNFMSGAMVNYAIIK